MPYMLNIIKMDTVITKTDSQRIWRNILVILSIHCIKYYQNRTTSSYSALFISSHCPIFYNCPKVKRTYQVIV